MIQRIKYYADEHIPKAVVQGLRRRGLDVISVPEARMLAATDEAHLSHAMEECRVLITEDDDFLRIHATGKQHAGIVFAPPGTSIGKMISGLMLIHQVLHAQEMRNHVEFI